MRRIGRAASFATLLVLTLAIGVVCTNIIVRSLFMHIGPLVRLGSEMSNVKIMPTIFYSAFGVLLLAGAKVGVYWVKYIMMFAFRLNEEGWRIITLRSGAFFLTLAVFNEMAWRTLGESAWVNFKVFGVVPLLILYAASQVGVLKYSLPTAPKVSGDSAH